MYSKWIADSGISRGTTISWPRSLITTSAARSIKVSLLPVAIALKVPVEHGHTTMRLGADDPEAMGENHSSFPYTCNCSDVTLKRSRNCSAIAAGAAGKRQLSSVANTTRAALDITTCSSCCCANKHSIKRSAYGAPEAPVMATVTLVDWFMKFPC